MIIQNIQDIITGTVERITYHNTENGFCVLRVVVKGHKDLVTIIGNVPSISAGEYIQCSGIWVNDRNHGKQFKAGSLKSLPPNTLDGIEKYLGSGLIKGIGSHFAKKLVLAFGDKVFDIIENKPHLLSKVIGIGKLRIENICNNWREQKIIREIMVFLQSHGVGTTRATRIYKIYGAKAIEIVSHNPYQLTKDIRGIGFLSADIIANNLGIEKNSLIRSQAGLSYVLLEAASNGHCGLPKEKLVENSKKLLEIEESLIELAIEEEVKSRNLVADYYIGDSQDQINTNMIFLASYYLYEKNIAKILLNLVKSPLSFKADTDTLIPIVENQLNIRLAESQKMAISQALENKVTVITGGPGTGKTTLVKASLKVLEAKSLDIKLCAPTGRAAKRLNETTGLEARTIHRLLEINPANGEFKRNEESPLTCDYLIIDEVSMVDVPLFHSLLKALPLGARLLLVGDVDQLPSVGAGQVLKDIIDSKAIV